MGNTATKFRKALINGDEILACQLYESNQQFRDALDPNSTYGESYQHNTPLHYVARHAMTRLLRWGWRHNVHVFVWVEQKGDSVTSEMFLEWL